MISCNIKPILLGSKHKKNEHLFGMLLTKNFVTMALFRLCLIVIFLAFIVKKEDLVEGRSIVGELSNDDNSNEILESKRDGFVILSKEDFARLRKAHLKKGNGALMYARGKERDYWN